MAPTMLAPVVVLAAVLFADAWVYADAKQRASSGSPVVLHLGSFIVDTPAMWFLGCFLLWIVFFPLYLRARS